MELKLSRKFDHMTEKNWN